MFDRCCVESPLARSSVALLTVKHFELNYLTFILLLLHVRLLFRSAIGGTSLFNRYCGCFCQCGRNLSTKAPYSMTDRHAPTLCRATSVVPSKVNVAAGHFAARSSSLAKI